jgi:hypothetical protein
LKTILARSPAAIASLALRKWLALGNAGIA